MAESIAILFKKVMWDELSSSITKIADSTAFHSWKYPSDTGDYSISLYSYDTWINECEGYEVNEIKKLLGGKPKSILCLELRRSQQNKACKDAKYICKKLLNQYDGIVDDAVDKLWLKEEIENSSKFLQCYLIPL